MATPASITLEPAPPDAVSRVCFSARGDILVSTWSGSLSVHDAESGLLKAEAASSGHPLLDATWTGSSGDALAAATLDGRVLRTTTGESGLAPWTHLGTHDAAARCVVSLGDLLATGSWDSSVRLWDPRLGKPQTMNVDVGGKVYAMSRCGEQVVAVATSERRVRLVDTRKSGGFVHDKAPPTLQYQLRGLSARADGKQYVVGSTEGRVAVEWLDGKEEPFSFKCHRADGLAFPVNAIAHNDKFGSFATGGGDGHVSFWDGEAKKRIAQYPRYPTSVASIGFDAKSERMVIAVSYTFEEGEKDHPPDEVHVVKVDEAHIATNQVQGTSLKNPEMEREKPAAKPADSKS